MNENINILFLRSKFHFWLLLAVVASTLLSWLNINSCLIVLLVCCRLFHGRQPLLAIHTAFSNPWFLAFFSIFVVEATGLFHTHDLYTAWKHVESKATLIAIPFVFCAGPFADKAGWRRFMGAYCMMLMALCLYCLVVAGVRYGQTHDPAVFFYHDLTAALSVNAVFFSGFVLMAQLFLLSVANSGWLRIALLIFFTGIMVLLASKLLLAMLVLVYLVYMVVRYRVRTGRRQFQGLMALVVVVTGALAFTRNPVGNRYQDIVEHHINGISFRLFIWHSTGEILDKEHAWPFGVSPGDSQDLLDGKYLEAGMSKGYLSYNFHNEYLEVLAHSGVVGLLLLLAAFGYLTVLIYRAGTLEGWFAWASLLLLALTESTFETQHSLFLCCFFPLLMCYHSKKLTPS
jgi:O-antigen ligase